MYVRLNVGIIVSLVTITLLIITTGIIDHQVRKNNIPVWRNVSPRIPDPNHCEVFIPNTVSNSTSYINTGQVVNGTIINGNLSNPFNNIVINNTEAFLRERYNSYTSIIFLFESIIPLFFFCFDLKDYCSKKNKYEKSIMVRYPIYSFFIFLVSMGHVIVTFTNHACSCKEGLIADNIGQWLMFGLYILYSLFVFTNDYTKSRTIYTYCLYISIYIVYGIIMTVIAIANVAIIIQNIITMIIIASIIIINIVGITRNKYVTGENKLFWASLVISVIGIIFDLLDDPTCNVGSSSGLPKIGLHFVYHIFGTIGITLLYLFHWTLIEDFDYIKSTLVPLDDSSREESESLKELV